MSTPLAAVTVAPVPPPGAQRVIDTIIARIRDGRYAPGQVIVARELSRELGLSKAPVREALHVLVGDGVIELLPNRSARIRALSAKDVLDFATFWGPVGGLAGRLAAEQIAAGDHRAQILAALDSVIAAAETRLSYRYFLAIAGFHRVVAAIGDNGYVRRFIERMHFEHYHRHISHYLPGRDWETHVNGFRGYCEAILAGDGERAERLFRAHLERATAILRTELARDGG